MKIVKLSAKNVLRLNAVEISPDGNLVVVGGENEQGKTSVLDSIFLAIGGRLAKHKRPLRDGTKSGSAVVDLGDIVVTRTFTEKGGTLKITNKEGLVYQSPQSILDGLTGKLTFDPLAWAGMDQKAQVDVLKKMTGIDFSEADKERQELYLHRQIINRDIKRIQGLVDSMPDFKDAPSDFISIEALMVELKKERQKNEAKNEKLTIIEKISTLINDADISILELKEKIEKLKRDLFNKMSAVKYHIAEKDKILSQIAEMPDGATQEIETKILEAEKVNKQVESNRKRWVESGNLMVAKAESETLTASIYAIDSAKQEKLQSAKMPIEHLSFDDDGVTYKGIPFDQCSSAERLRVSVAMGIAMNPKLKILLIRDGSLLDEKNLKLISEMATEADCQIWLERVGKGKECSVIIEDGCVLEGGKQ